MNKQIKLSVSDGAVNVTSTIVNKRVFLIVKSGKASNHPIVRFHSSCVFGEAFGAIDCDCGEQLRSALDFIIKEGGYIIYAWDEGRGLGIEKKIKAISLQQEEGLDTAEAFKKMGHQPEPRDFVDYASALSKVCNTKTIRFASNNPSKIKAMVELGYEIIERVHLNVKSTHEREEYLKEKQAALGHLNNGF